MQSSPKKYMVLFSEGYENERAPAFDNTNTILEHNTTSSPKVYKEH